MMSTPGAQQVPPSTQPPMGAVGGMSAPTGQPQIPAQQPRSIPPALLALAQQYGSGGAPAQGALSGMSGGGAPGQGAPPPADGLSHRDRYLAQFKNPAPGSAIEKYGTAPDPRWLALAERADAMAAQPQPQKQVAPAMRRDAPGQQPTQAPFTPMQGFQGRPQSGDQAAKIRAMLAQMTAGRGLF